MGGGCIPSLLFDLKPNYGGGNEDNGGTVEWKWIKEQLDPGCVSGKWTTLRLPTQTAKCLTKICGKEFVK